MIAWKPSPPGQHRPAHGESEKRCCRILDTVGFIQDGSLKRGKNGGFAVPSRCAAQSKIGEEKVVIHNQEIRLRGCPLGFKIEASAIKRASEPRAFRSVGGDLLPRIFGGGKAQVRAASVTGIQSPFHKLYELPSFLHLE